MYSWIDGRRFSDSKYFPAVNFISKNCVPFIRSQYELGNVRRLPVIKEEDGYLSGEELPKNLLRNNLLKKKYVTQKNPATNFKNENVSKDPKSLTRFPSLGIINCLMNTEIKQTRSIWDTNFGKRFISGKNIDEEVKSVPTETKKIRPNIDKSRNKKYGEYRTSKPISRRKIVRNIKSSGGDKGKFNEITTNKKKSKNNNKDKQNTKKKINKEKMQVKMSESTVASKSTVKFLETPSRELTESCATKNRRFLTECVQSILDGHNDENYCEQCNENFQNFEESCKHKKQYDAEKEICLLCDKVFYNPNEFIWHLLTHEDVDRFSCKKCKKYFPSLKKYKQHCFDYHFRPPEVTNSPSQSTKEVLNACENYLTDIDEK